MEFMIITVYNWFAESRFFVGVHWMEFADTTLGISEQYLFFLPPDWDGWPLNSHHIFINYIKFPLLHPN
jgi:hypothetical protein